MNNNFDSSMLISGKVIPTEHHKFDDTFRNNYEQQEEVKTFTRRRNKMTKSPLKLFPVNEEKAVLPSEYQQDQ